MFNLSMLGVSAPALNDAVDILIVAFLVYKIIIWIKDSRAWSLFKGIVFLLLAYAMAYKFQLNTISWIISNTFAVGITAVIVLFQPELRKGLEQIGNRKILKLFLFDQGRDDTSSVSGTIDEIIKAAVKLSDARTGALILIERETGLGDLERTGIRLDAEVTYQLLINIFEDKTPLHDGAVIIRKNRIAAATCILPLTQSELSSDLGTRHRAAVGASEVCDANVLVVSEETGGISIAVGGKLHRGLSEEQLKSMLIEEQEPVKRKITLRKGR